MWLQCQNYNREEQCSQPRHYSLSRQPPKRETYKSIKCLLLEHVGNQTRKTKWEGVSEFGIRKAWGVEHFEISKGKGGGGMFLSPVVGYGYFLESPNSL